MILDFARLMLEERIDSYLVVVPGPDLPPSMPNRCVVLTLTGGPGEITEEGAFTAISFQARCIGEQNDYDSAESLAFAVDRIFRAVPTQTVPVSDAEMIRLLSLVRSGPPPSALMVDDADRHHFVASYIATVGSL